jgi:D-alanyl-D-alanine carboxypeptidase
VSRAQRAGRYGLGMDPARGTSGGRARSGWTPTRRTILGASALVGVGGILAACASPDPPSGGTSTAGSTGTAGAAATPFALDDTTMPKLDQLFDQVMASTSIAGMAGAVWMGDKVWKRAGGYADLAQKTPYDPAANVRIASVTKSFTATAVLQLVDAGALKLDDVLEKFVPGIANGATITMRNLLGMTSGIYDFTSNAAFNTRFDANPDMPWTFADTLAIIKANQPLFAPGTDIAYCDSNYSILGEIIQMVTGKPARTVIADSIAAKLSLTHTFWPADSAIPAPHPNGYVPQGLDPAKPNQAFDNTAHPPKVVNAVNPAVAAGAGAMISTLDDLKIWGREIAEGRLLTPATQAERLKARRFNGAPVNLGYGLGCERVNDFTGHNGAIYGFSTVVFRYPPADLTLAVVGNESTNSTTPTSTFGYQFIRQFYPAQWT